MRARECEDTSARMWVKDVQNEEKQLIMYVNRVRMCVYMSCTFCVCARPRVHVCVCVLRIRVTRESNLVRFLRVYRNFYINYLLRQSLNYILLSSITDATQC